MKGKDWRLSYGKASMPPSISTDRDALRVVLAGPQDCDDYLELLEEIAEWLHVRGVGHVQPATYRKYATYYNASIAAGEVHLGIVGFELVGSFRFLQDGGIVWPGAS